MIFEAEYVRDDTPSALIIITFPNSVRSLDFHISKLVSNLSILRLKFISLFPFLSLFPFWSLKGYTLASSVTKPDEPFLYNLYDGPGEAGVRPRRAFVCAAKYSATDVKLDRLRVNPTRQHPAFVIISAHAQLLLLICSYLPLTIPNPPFSALSVLPLSAALKRSQVILFCLFDMPFVMKFFSSLFCSSTL